MHRVSIVMSVYNEEVMLEEVLDSVLGQAFSDFELIVVDNASTDRSLEICKDRASGDPRMSVFSNVVNVGPIMNFNRCLQRATADYVRLLSANDVSAENELTDLVGMLDESPDAALVYATHVEPEPDQYPTLDQVDPLDRVANLIKKFQSGHMIYGLIRRSVLDNVYPIRSKMSSDQIYLAEIALHGQILPCDTRSYRRKMHVRTEEDVARLCSDFWPRRVDDPKPFTNAATALTPVVDLYDGYCHMVDHARVPARVQHSLGDTVRREVAMRWRRNLEKEADTMLERAQALTRLLQSSAPSASQSRYAAALLSGLARVADLGFAKPGHRKAASKIDAALWQHAPKTTRSGFSTKPWLQRFLAS
ncbi:MAG: glycosyltransferase family 2 protein [Pseudomonadota bacterium]